MDTRNAVMLIGRLVGDPELRYLPNGTPVANFAIAVNRSVRKDDGSYDDSLDGFFDCEFFGGQAVTLAETASKGTEVTLVGSLRQNKFQTKGQPPRTISKVEIRVTQIAPTLPAAKEPAALPVAAQSVAEQAAPPAEQAPLPA